MLYKVEHYNEVRIDLCCEMSFELEEAYELDNSQCTKQKCFKAKMLFVCVSAYSFQLN